MTTSPRTDDSRLVQLVHKEGEEDIGAFVVGNVGRDQQGVEVEERAENSKQVYTQRTPWLSRFVTDAEPQLEDMIDLLAKTLLEQKGQPMRIDTLVFEKARKRTRHTSLYRLFMEGDPDAKTVEGYQTRMYGYLQAKRQAIRKAAVYIDGADGTEVRITYRRGAPTLKEFLYGVSLGFLGGAILGTFLWSGPRTFVWHPTAETIFASITGMAGGVTNMGYHRLDRYIRRAIFHLPNNPHSVTTTVTYKDPALQDWAKMAMLMHHNDVYTAAKQEYEKRQELRKEFPQEKV